MQRFSAVLFSLHKCAARPTGDRRLIDPKERKTDMTKERERAIDSNSNIRYQIQHENDRT
jgi:hypothetical protein